MTGGELDTTGEGLVLLPEEAQDRPPWQDSAGTRVQPQPLALPVEFALNLLASAKPVVAIGECEHSLYRESHSETG